MLIKVNASFTEVMLIPVKTYLLLVLILLDVPVWILVFALFVAAYIPAILLLTECTLDCLYTLTIFEIRGCNIHLRYKIRSILPTFSPNNMLDLLQNLCQCSTCAFIPLHLVRP